MTRKKGLLIIGVIIGIAALIYFFVINRSPEVKVSSMEVVEGSIQQSMDIAGKIISEDIQEILIPAGTEVLQVMVKEGDRVSKGDVLAALDPSELQTRLAKLRINLEQVEADLRMAGGSADRQILQNNLQKAQEALSSVQRDYETAKDNLGNLKVLYENGAISLSEYEYQENALKSLESSMKSAKLNVEDARLRYSDFGATTSSTTGSLDRQKRSLLLDIQQLEKQIEDTRITADLDGTVVAMELMENRTVGREAEVVVQNTERFKFEASVTQEDAVNIRPGQDATIKVSGISNEYSGQVVEIGSKAEIDSSSGSSTPKVKVTIALNEADDRLVSGFDADAEITTGMVENVVLVKNEAIREDDQAGSYVFTIENGFAVKTPVTRGITDRYLTEIKEGILLGDRVILNPPQELEDGSAVSVTE
ncbi:efflux RND transporter periplasmic adaptor subunit [Gudongella sp. SC589]|jgi:HlyD family secretion protein|uniref:efflux RND transporter periplasmic adaptor subunit n=1 Tax=Gudongella sp. SC589 TaxID=3385990 RepID=UPI003904D2EA